MIRLLKVVVLLGILATIGVGVWMWQWLATPIAALNEPRVYEVQRGATFRSIGRELKDAKLIDFPQMWTQWARLTGRASHLKAGEYQLTPGLTPRALADVLESGVVIQHAITFIEGSTYSDIRQLLRNDAFVRQTLDASTDADLMKQLDAAGVHPEGQFFPDTYLFPKDTSDLELLRIAHRRLQTELTAAWETHSPKLNLRSEYEALILASIVEKESALARERPIIAGVFLERLNRGMRLQTDPTVIYGLGDSYDGNITRADLTHDTPYNTYTRSGLPPTPIALPGADSLRAATQPAMSGAIYFVATGNGDGSHHFSTTLAEHNAAVQRYLERLRARP
jgi:UPF0755 protein